MIVADHDLTHEYKGFATNKKFDLLDLQVLRFKQRFIVMVKFMLKTLSKS